MKKILFSLLIVFFALDTFSQLTGGVKGGLNFAQVHAKVSGDSELSDMLIGFQLGGYLNYPLSDKVSIQPELVFTRVGGKESMYDPDLQEDVTIAYKNDYLSIPLMFSFKAGDKFHILAGPQVGILVGAKAKVEVLGQSVSIDVKDVYKTLDFGLTAGFGYTINKVGIDARYNFGLANIADGTSGGDKAQNRVIMLAVSYKLFEK